MISIANQRALFRLFALTTVFAVGIAAILASSGNGGSRIKVLTFDYDVRRISNVGDAIRDLDNGTRTVNSLLPPTPCHFAVASSTPPRYNLRGQPGQVGATVAVIATNPSNASNSNPAGCSVIGEFNLQIGTLSAALNLGAAQTQTNAIVKIGSDEYQASTGFFIASLDTHDSSDGYITGQFEFLAQKIGDTDAVIIAKGSYGGN